MTSLFDKVLKRKVKGADAFEQFSKKYTMTDVVLGEGAYASVRMALRKSNNQKVAVKIIDKSGLSQKELRGLSKEVDILRKLRHKHVVKLYDSFEQEDVMYVVMEYVGGGELFNKILKHDAPFTEGDVKRIVGTLAEALKHCKENGVIHRDIKPQNLLLTDNQDLKLADFNLSIQLDPNKINFSVVETMCGTPNYVAPEILTGHPYDYKCDIWSLGVICYLLLSGGYLPFYVDEEGELGKEMLLRKVKKGRWGFQPEEVWENVSDNAKGFLRKVLERDPEKRYDYNALLNHSWLKSHASDGHAISTAGFEQAANKARVQTAGLTLLAAKKFEAIMEDVNHNKDGTNQELVPTHLDLLQGQRRDSGSKFFEDDI